MDQSLLKCFRHMEAWMKEDSPKEYIGQRKMGPERGISLRGNGLEE